MRQFLSPATFSPKIWAGVALAAVIPAFAAWAPAASPAGSTRPPTGAVAAAPDRPDQPSTVRLAGALAYPHAEAVAQVALIAATAAVPPPPPVAPPVPAPAPAHAAAPAATPAAPSGYGCGPALAYLQAHAAPGFTFQCPGSALGHQAMTCVNVAGICGGTKLIAIARPCAAAYMNEASNSWVMTGQRRAPIDPYGSCGA